MAEQYRTVYDKKRRPVAAKALVDKNGNDIINPLSSMPLLVPVSFDVEAAVRFGLAIAERRKNYAFDRESPLPIDAISAGLELVKAVRRGGSWELQRTYNDVKGGGFDEFVEDFTAAASFAFGLIGRAAGFSDLELQYGGGIYNLASSLGNSNINTGGYAWNNPNNVRLISSGVKSFENARFDAYSDKKPIDIQQCFVAGTLVLMSDGTNKPIERIQRGDAVMAFDSTVNGGRNRVLPRIVSRRFQNRTRQIVDLRGLKCTPGHVFLTGQPNEIGSGEFKTIAAILKDDGTIVDKDGQVMRARTGAIVDSIDDILVEVAVHNLRTGTERPVLVRAGIPAVTERRLSKSGKSLARTWSLAEWVGKHGVDVLADGTFRTGDGSVFKAIDWPAGSTPFDTVETQNWVVGTEGGKPYTPPWIADLTEEDERATLEVAG